MMNLGSKPEQGVWLPALSTSFTVPGDGYYIEPAYNCGGIYPLE